MYLEPKILRTVMNRTPSRASVQILTGSAYTYVERRAVDASALGSPDWQVVYGRPGSGKSLLLLHAARQTDLAISDTGVCALWLSARDGLISLPTNLSPEIEIVARFQQLVHRIVEEMRLLPERHTFIDGSLSRSRRAAFKRSLDQVLTCIDGRPAPTAAGSHTTDHEQIEQRGTRRSVEAEVRLRKRVPTLGGSGLSERSRQSKKSTNLQVPSAISEREAGHAISEAVACLGLERLHIYLDDWTGASDGLSPHAQLLFESMIRNLLADRPRLSLKIGANRFSARLGGGTGLTVGTDVFEVADLDLCPPGEESVLFLRSILDGMLALGDPHLATLAADHGIRPSSLISQDPLAWETLSGACASNPRRLMVVLRHALQHADGRALRPSDILVAVRDDAGFRFGQVPYGAQQYLRGSAQEVEPVKGVAIIDVADPPPASVIEPLIGASLLNPVRGGEQPTPDGSTRYWMDLGAWLHLERSEATTGGHRGAVHPVTAEPVLERVWATCARCPQEFHGERGRALCARCGHSSVAGNEGS